MRGAYISLIALIALVGCDSLGKVNVENPVMPPAPPRTGVSTADAQLDGDAYVNNPLDPTVDDVKPGEIVPTQFNQQVTDGQFDLSKHAKNLSGNEVVATVNGTPIFAAEVLERYGRQLARAKQQVTPENLRKIRETLIRQDLNGHVDRVLLVQSLRSSVPKEQLEMLDKHLNKAFQDRIQQMMQDLGVNTKHELELKLQTEQYTSLAKLRNAYVNQLMATEYLKLKSKQRQKISRPDMLAYYDDHIDEYQIPAQVKWQQIVLYFDKHGGEQKTFRVLEEAIAELKSGTEFGPVAGKYSDGPKSSQKGQWDWTQVGSLSDEKIERALFELPPGTISQVLVSDRGYHLVSVNDRKEAGLVPFEEVQTKIEGTLDRQARREATQKVLDEIRENAMVETIFDDRGEDSEKLSLR